MEIRESRQSLYEYIEAHLEGGVLPSDFSLPQEKLENGLRFADGAMDGMAMYHMMGQKPDEEKTKQMAELIGLISAGENEKADEALLEFAKKNRAISVIDDFEDYIRKNRASLNPGNIYQYGVRQIFESIDKECVKYGLEILELFVLKNEQVKDAIRVLGLSDEFTLFALFVMQQWENANEEIFALARKVTGWGRIHAIEKLQPETEEIKEWLLLEGIRNHIMPEYSALTCFEKAGVIGRLDGELSDDAFRSIGMILSAMLSEGPVPGISAVEHKEEILVKYLQNAEEKQLGLEDYEIILQIYHYGNEKEERLEAVCKLCEELFDAEDCKKVVKEALREGKGIELAMQLKIEYKTELFASLKRDFNAHFGSVRYLMQDEAYVDDVILLFTERLPLAQMATGPQNEMGLGQEFADFQKLDFILQELRGKTGKGELLIKTALQSPVVRNRNMAVAVLKSWAEKEEKTLDEIVPALYDTLLSAEKIEVREDVKTRMKEVIGYGKMA